MLKGLGKGGRTHEGDVKQSLHQIVPLLRTPSEPRNSWKALHLPLVHLSHCQRGNEERRGKADGGRTLLKTDGRKTTSASKPFISMLLCVHTTTPLCFVD